MTSLESKKSILMSALVLGYIAGFILIFIGAYFIYIGSSSDIEFNIFGQQLRTGSVGIAIIILGVIIIILVSRGVLTSAETSTEPTSSVTHNASSNPGKVQEYIETRIVISVPGFLQRKDFDFGLLHIRNGKDDVPGIGPPINDELEFNRIDRDNYFEAVVRTSSKTGFQYKCFVDHPGTDFDKVKALLIKAGFISVSEGEGKPNRAWFLIPGKPTYTTVDGIVNNFYYPS